MRAQLPYLGKRIRMETMTPVGFMTIRVTNAREEDNRKFMTAPEIALVLGSREGIASHAAHDEI